MVTIRNWTTGVTNNRPVIDSRGFIRAPLLAGRTPDWFVAQAGAPALGRDCLVRGVRVTTRPHGLFTKAMVANRSITLNGGVTTDSFNSEDPAASANGRYDPAKSRDHGDVAANGQMIKAVNNLGNVKIRGRVSTGPGGTVERPQWRRQTHFETRGLKLGHGVWDLLYDRIG